MRVGLWHALLLVMQRELRLSFRRPDLLLLPLVFFLIVTTLFPLGLSVQLSLLRDMAPGVLWVAALLASLLSLDALFKSDADDGTLEQLALSGQGLTVIVVAKTLAHWLVSGAALVLVSPLVGFRSWFLLSAWWGSWHFTQSRTAGLWILPLISLAFLSAWQVKQTPLVVVATSLTRVMSRVTRISWQLVQPIAIAECTFLPFDLSS